ERASSIEVLVTVRSAPSAADVRAWTRSLVSEARAKRARLSILLCGDRRMGTLNSKWRGVDRPTDVLSFPAFEASVSPAAGGGGAVLGGLVTHLPAPAP